MRPTRIATAGFALQSALCYLGVTEVVPTSRHTHSSRQSSALNWDLAELQQTELTADSPSSLLLDSLLLRTVSTAGCAGGAPAGKPVQ
jgi:hypothetical protein